MELLEAIENGNLFTVKVKVAASFMGRMFGGKDRVDEMVFNTETGSYSQTPLIAMGSLEIALHEYHKKYGTYGPKRK